MARRCQNQYRHCLNNAVRDKGSNINDRLCAECLARRREKQALSAAQPTCHCGNKAAIGKTECRRCEDLASEQAVGAFNAELVAAILEDYADLQRSGQIPSANRYAASDAIEQAEAVLSLA